MNRARAVLYGVAAVTTLVGCGDGDGAGEPPDVDQQVCDLFAEMLMVPSPDNPVALADELRDVAKTSDTPNVAQWVDGYHWAIFDGDVVAAEAAAAPLFEFCRLTPR
jgi:hypothetical protein